MRLAKYLAHAGVASRRAAEEIVRAGRVTVGGEVVTDPARDVDDDEPRRGRRPRRCAGPRSATVYAGQQAARRRVDGQGHARPPDGRLARARRAARGCTRSAGSTPTRPACILLTNDGELANRLTHPRYEVPKTYIAERDRRVRARGARCASCARASSSRTAGPRPAQVRQVEPGVLQITIHEGRKRQVRRMVEAIGHRVIELRRVALRAARPRRPAARQGAQAHARPRSSASGRPPA